MKKVLFTKALDILLSPFNKTPGSKPYSDGRWRGLGPKYPDLHKKRGTVNKYADKHPRTGHPHGQECERRQRQIYGQVRHYIK